MTDSTQDFSIKRPHKNGAGFLGHKYLKSNAPSIAIVYKFLPLQKWGQLYLVDRWCDFGNFQQFLQMANAKVADTYVLAQALHSSTCANKMQSMLVLKGAKAQLTGAALCRRHGPVDTAWRAAAAD